MSLRVKLVAICVALLAAFGIKGYFALQSLESIGHLATEMYDDTVMSVNYIQIAGRSFDTADVQLARALQFDNRMNLQTALTDFNKMIADLSDNLNVVLQRTADTDAQAKIKDTLAAIETWRGEAAAKLGGNGDAKSLVADDVLAKQRADVKEKVDQLTEDILAIGYTARTNAESTIAAKRKGDLIATVVIVLTGLIAVLVLANHIVKPIRTACGAAARIAGGAFDDVISTRRRDEVGQLLTALEAMRQSLHHQHAEDLRRADEKAQEATLSAERQNRMENAIASFDTRSHDLIEKVAAASTALMQTAQEMAEMARGATGLANDAQGNADQASRGIGRISDESKRLADAIIGITQLVDKSSSIGQRAVQQMDETAATVSSLDELSNKIGEVVDLIRQVANQTNLLALNATIEAARAGDAGKGFAVVASEVKNLAMQTAKATDEITSKVALLQSAATQTSTAIKGFGETVSTIRTVSSEISQAVTVQNSSTQEISSNAATTAADASQLSATIGTLSVASKKTGDASQQVLSAGTTLAEQSKSLQEEISTFIGAIRAA